ncbi:uncharacterized protein A1O9_05921 [Exophiala aquamarina CBS 119918]|uniref:non-specific serine/threonine protein kinase n=1 Tax=Exophiala aquamarina CBS 119918 TaxID=1182545 RepID=A0A072PFE5_9EURO|nr:uncharacterized protein A1O9_05921 [Exophiala aquamarina CBS 119918]KEF57998.1 hypothetical protein A1O9_05921 [Exophiala aquamarina CBS 119918]
MATTQDEKVDAKVRKGLAGTSFEPSSLQRLSGGLVNWGYQAALLVPLDDGTSEVFLKHGETFLAKIPDFEVGLLRCRMEAQALRHLTEFPFAGQTDHADSHRFIVLTPKLLYFDEANTTQIHGYIPNSTTLQAYILQHYSAPTNKSQEIECRQMGKAIGRWMNEFVKYTASQPEIKQCAVDNRDAQPIRHQFSYGWLHDRIEEYPRILSETKEILEHVLRMATEELEDESRLQVVHGDLAPANIVLSDRPLEEHRETRIFVVDWEVIHMGGRHFDFGQMAVELYLLWLRKGITAGLWILEGLITAFHGLDEDLAFRVAIHMGSYLICMAPLTPEWGTPEQIEDLVRAGRDILFHAWNKDGVWFGNSELACLFTCVPSSKQ